MFDENSNNNSNNVMAMVNHLMNIKDSRWLQVEVCREFQRGQCTRTDQDCKFAHPPPHVDVQNGRVTACYDSIKGRCTRENPKCKYLHPPQHLKDQLLINGRNNLALKNLLVSQLTNPLGQMGQIGGGASIAAMPGAAMVPSGVTSAFSYYPLNATTVYPGLYPAAASPDALQNAVGVLPAGTAASPASLAVAQQQQKARSDRVEVCREFLRGSCQRPEAECKFAHPPPDVERGTDGSVTVCMDFVRGAGREGACQRLPCRYFHPPQHLLALVRARMGGLEENGVTNGTTTVPVASTSHAASAAASLALAAQQLIRQPVSQAAQVQAQLTAAQQLSAATSVAPSTTERGKKRPLEQETQSIQSQAMVGDNTTSLLLAAAALQQQQQQQQQQAQTVPNKRPAIEKSGLPVYQPAMPTPAALQYPMTAQLAFPSAAGFQSYFPAVTFPVSAGGGGLAPCPELALSPASPALFQQTQLALPGTRIPDNVASVAYFDEAGQLLDTLPVCRDFKQGHCERPNCRYVHLYEEYVEVHDGKVTVCRDFAKGKCTRVMCKYYHVPVLPGSNLLLSRLMQPAPVPYAGDQTTALLLQQHPGVSSSATAVQSA